MENGNILLSNVISSSMDMQSVYGGVVPEIAARSHIEVIMPVIEQALAEAKTNWDGIDGIAIVNGAGLSGFRVLRLYCGASRLGRRFKYRS